MIALIQRVKSAAVIVDDKTTGKIGAGLLVFLCVVNGDNQKDATALAKKIVELRIFNDESGRFNRGLRQIDGNLLVVSQFTLAADYKKGRRPSFTKSAPPDQAEKLYNFFIKECRKLDVGVETGIFAASMQVSLINDGPVTMIIDSSKLVTV